MRREPALSRRVCGRISDIGTIEALAVPIRRYAQGDWPVRRLLKDRGVPFIHHLITVVFEGLSEIVELGPSFMTGRARHAVLPREGRDGIHLACRDRQCRSATAANQ